MFIGDNIDKEINKHDFSNITYLQSKSGVKEFKKEHN